MKSTVPSAPAAADLLKGATIEELLFVEGALAFRREAEAAAVAAPHGKILAVAEDAVVAGSRKLLARTLQGLLQERAAAAEKKGPPNAAAPTAKPGAAAMTAGHATSSLRLAPSR